MNITEGFKENVMMALPYSTRSISSMKTKCDLVGINYARHQWLCYYFDVAAIDIEFAMFNAYYTWSIYEIWTAFGGYHVLLVINKLLYRSRYIQAERPNELSHSGPFIIPPVHWYYRYRYLYDTSVRNHDIHFLAVINMVNTWTGFQCKSWSFANQSHV